MFFVFLLFPLITFRLSSIFFLFRLFFSSFSFKLSAGGYFVPAWAASLSVFVLRVRLLSAAPLLFPSLRRFSFVFLLFFFWDSIWCEKYDRLFFLLLFHCLVLQCRWFLRARPADKTRIRLARIWEPPTFNLWFSVLSHFSKASAARLACQRSQWMLIMSKRPLLIVRLLLPGNNKNGRGDRIKREDSQNV